MPTVILYNFVIINFLHKMNKNRDITNCVFSSFPKPSPWSDFSINEIDLSFWENTLYSELQLKILVVAPDIVSTHIYVFGEGVGIS